MLPNSPVKGQTRNTFDVFTALLLPSSDTEMNTRQQLTLIYMFLCMNLAVIYSVHVIYTSADAVGIEV